MDYSLRHIEGLDWITVIMVSLLVLIAITRHLYPRRFQEFVLLPITNKYFALQGKGYEINHPFNMVFFVVQVLSFSLFIYLFITTNNKTVAQTNPWLFLQICTGFGVFVLVKYISEKIIAHVFHIETIVNNYLYEKLSYVNLLSVVTLIGNAIFYYVFTPSLSILLGFALAIMLFYTISFISSFKRNRNVILRHFFYFILYLCALEIAPYIILAKTLV